MDTEEWYMPDVATFGDRLTAAREQAKMTQADLARKLGVKKVTLANWEEDLNEPRANRLQMLSGLLGVSLKWLLTGEGDDVEIDQTHRLIRLCLVKSARSAPRCLRRATAWQCWKNVCAKAFK